MTTTATRLALSTAVIGGIFLLYRRISQKIKLGNAIFNNKWFSELGPMWPGQAFSLEIKQILYEGTSKFQKIQVFDTVSYGRVLVLDGIFQCTEKDECAYQEMMAHVPLYSHSCPKKVLVIGGGDGGVLREIARHPEVEEIHICELDDEVIRVSKEYLPQLAVGFDDRRVEVHIADGFVFMQQHEGEFDVIIVDSSDPVGPAEVLFKEPFYKAMRAALRPGGIAVTQGECMWVHQDTIKEVCRFSRRHFASVEYGFVSIPSYPCGTIGMLCCSADDSHRVLRPIRIPTPAVADQLQYYTQEIHKASFVLPAFIQRALA